MIFNSFDSYKKVIIGKMSISPTTDGHFVCVLGGQLFGNVRHTVYSHSIVHSHILYHLFDYTFNIELLFE